MTATALDTCAPDGAALAPPGGPDDRPVPGASPAAMTASLRAGAGHRAACRRLIRHGSHSFFLSSLLLPRSVALPATALYAFCRVADDMIDGPTDAAAAAARAAGTSVREAVARAADERGTRAAVAELSDRLDRIYAGVPGEALEDRALAEVVADYGLPRAMPEALLEGLAWDASGREYETLSELYDYAARVAGCVGAMMTLVMRTSDARAIARACDLGVAMQLTNIARDVGEDARMGRLYLPRRWFRDEGLDPDAWLADPVEDPRVARITERLLAHAEILYRRSEAGVGLLPFGCRAGIRAARLVYADIGRSVARAGYRNVERRAVVPPSRKLALLGRALAGVPFAGGARRGHDAADALAWPPLSETRYLLEDVESVPRKPRIEWLVDLFADLHRQRHP